MLTSRTVVSLPADELDRVYRTCSPPYRAIWASAGWQAVLSCNNSYEVWPTPALGKTPLEAREYLPLEDFPHLRLVVREVLKHKDIGGRIFVRDDVFYFSPGEGKEELCVAIVQRQQVAPQIRSR